MDNKCILDIDDKYFFSVVNVETFAWIKIISIADFVFFVFSTRRKCDLYPGSGGFNISSQYGGWWVNIFIVLSVIYY